MPAAVKNITIEAGASFRLPIVWKDAEGSPVDLTGYKARAQIRGSYNGETLIAFSSEEGSIELGGVAGTITLLAEPSVTRAVQRVAGAGVWDLEMVEPAGGVKRLLEGKARFSKEVTR